MGVRVCTHAMVWEWMLPEVLALALHLLLISMYTRVAGLWASWNSVSLPYLSSVVMKQTSGALSGFWRSQTLVLIFAQQVFYLVSHLLNLKFLPSDGFISDGFRYILSQDFIIIIIVLLLFA